MYKNIFIILNLAIAFILAIMFSNFSIIIINLFMLLTMIAIIKREDDIIYKHILIIYFICIIAMLVVYFGYMSKYKHPYYLGGSDDLNFEIWANNAIKSNNYTIQDVAHNKMFKYYNCNGFIWFLSIIIRFCNIFDGYHTVILRLINIYLLIFTGILVFKYVKAETGNISKRNIWLLYLVTLFPNYLYISVHGFRDNLFSFIVFSIFYLTININKKSIGEILKIIVYIIISSYLIYYIRKIGLYYIVLIITLNLLLGKKQINNKKVILAFGAMLTVGVLLAIKMNVINDITKYQNRYNEYILEDSNGISGYVFSLPIFPFGIILRLVYGNMFPSPTGIILRSFDIDSICKFIISIGTIVQVYMLPYLFKNIKKIDSIFMTYVIMFVIIIITTFNFRHFSTIYPFMFILIERQFTNSNKHEKKQFIFIVTLSILFGIVLYLINEVV